MFKKIQIDMVAATFKLLRLSLAVTIWSCHLLAAPAVRLCHSLAATIFGLQGVFIGGRSTGAIISENKISGCSSHGVLSSLFLRYGHAKTKDSELYPELLPPRSALAKAGRTPNVKGFTQIELMAVIIIIGILAATVASKVNFGSTSSMASVNGGAYMVASDIRYAQEWAMANRASKTVTFLTSSPSAYTFNPTSSLDPSGQLPPGVTISSNFTITFDCLGEPTTGGGGSVTVSGGGQTHTISVVNYTGKVNIS